MVWDVPGCNFHKQNKINLLCDGGAWSMKKYDRLELLLLLLFGSTTVVGQGLPVPLVGLAFSDQLISPIAG